MSLSRSKLVVYREGFQDEFCCVSHQNKNRQNSINLVIIFEESEPVFT